MRANNVMREDRGGLEGRKAEAGRNSSLVSGTHVEECVWRVARNPAKLHLPIPNEASEALRYWKAEARNSPMPLNPPIPFLGQNLS